MPIADHDVVWITTPQVGVFEALYLPAIFEGLKTTVGHLFEARLTRQYPEVGLEYLPPNYRGVHRLNRDEQGRVKCVACFMCATACPAHCIEIEAEDAVDWPDRDKRPRKFVLDELRCIFCGMCEEACPCDAIELTSQATLTGDSRASLLFDKERLLRVFDETKDNPQDPIRTQRGILGPASQPVRNPAHPVNHAALPTHEGDHP